MKLIFFWEHLAQGSILPESLYSQSPLQKYGSGILSLFYKGLNLKRIKYITLFQHTQFRGAFKTQLDFYDGAFLQK